MTGGVEQIYSNCDAGLLEGQRRPSELQEVRTSHSKQMGSRYLLRGTREGVALTWYRGRHAAPTGPGRRRRFSARNEGALEIEVSVKLFDIVTVVLTVRRCLGVTVWYKTVSL